MSEIDNELLSGYLDGELSAAEHEAVARLVAEDSNWADSFRAFQETAKLLKKLPTRELPDPLRALAFNLAESNKEAGFERRRVPRYKRRWMLVAAMLLPAVFTLIYFQNPNSVARLYVKKDRLELQARRSIAEEKFQHVRTWTSPKLWGSYFPDDESGVNFQVDSEADEPQEVQASVYYDFNGDGIAERVEIYEYSKLDTRKGWERFMPKKLQVSGGFESFESGLVTLKLEVKDPTTVVKLSGTPGEIILPYRGLRSSKGAQ